MAAISGDEAASLVLRSPSPTNTVTIGVIPLGLSHGMG